MITYVINTSENKTFDSDQLFRLVGYKKICWMNSDLNEIEKCADEICEKQNVLCADDFRIAVIIDFYSFDRIRKEYGLRGYSEGEDGVDISTYYPFIEAYISDHLFINIQKRELFIKEKDIFYIQNNKNTKNIIMNNEREQLATIFKPIASSLITEEEADDAVIEEKDIDEKSYKDIQKEEELKSAEKEGVQRYSDFSLYCSDNVSLTFSLNDYPYTNKKGLSFDEFYNSFKLRESELNMFRRHYFYASFSGGPSKAAFDNLSLSLFLIRKYEREESMLNDEEVNIDKIDADRLVETLVLAWNKASSAREIALINNSQYYDIKKYSEFINRKHAKEEPEEKQLKSYRDRIKRDDKNPPDVITAYKQVINCAMHSNDDDLEKENKQEFDNIMSNYLKKRDDTKESSVENIFTSEKDSQQIPMINQNPSKMDYENIIEKKEKEISDIFAEALGAEYINVDYAREKNSAEKSFRKYTMAKNSLEKGLFGDLFLWLFAMIIMIVPYAFAQMKIESVSTIGAIVLYLYTAAVFTGIFILAFLIKITPLVKKMRDAKKEILECYYSCLSKKKYSFSKLKRRYETDLVNIEEIRYEIRQITHLYNINLMINKRVDGHREMLEVVEDRLSSMLNNLGVEPVVIHYNNLDGEFDMTKPFQSPENKVYKVFSLDTIETLFAKKGV